MAERRAIVTSPDGLHARPAALFVRAVGDSGIAVRIAKVSTDRVGTNQPGTNQPGTNQPGTSQPSADGRSILAVLGLDVRQGDEVLLSADGDGADEALDRLVAMLTEDTHA